ncbi:MAG: hypothetical protein ACYS15_06945 [Planctomycetota bacterium]|jgi:hypothetical protein
MNDETQPTRRAFMRGVAKKAVYVAPAVLAMQAAQRAGADFTGCAGPGSPCTLDAECCSVVCLNANMMDPCGGTMNCICQ